LPLGILVKGSTEVYRDFADRIFSLGFFTNGLNIGIYELFGPPAPYSLSAGARTIFMIPKISEMGAHRKLKYVFNVRGNPPKELFDQWHLFKELARNFKNLWECEIYFLTSRWVEEMPNKLGWLRFKNYLLEKAWKQTEYARNRTVFEVSWKDFCEVVADKGLPVNPYLIETLRNLIFIAQGALPAFTPARDNSVAGPTPDLQRAYIEGYGLKLYVPTLMIPWHFSLNEDIAVYYSLQSPTALEVFPKSRNPPLDQFPDLKALYKADIAIRATEHEDITLFSLLPSSGEKGLEVKDLNGNWHPAPSMENAQDALVINIGDMLSLCTGGYYLATTHRVLAPSEENTNTSRYSLAFFLNPRDDVQLDDKHTALSCLKSHLQKKLDYYSETALL
jgi:hypothetical protein